MSPSFYPPSFLVLPRGQKRPAGTRGELLPALLRPAGFDEAQASIEGRDGSGTKTCQEGPAPCCMDALCTLDKQCAVFKRSAEAMGRLPMHVLLRSAPYTKGVGHSCVQKTPTCLHSYSLKV